MELAGDASNIDSYGPHLTLIEHIHRTVFLGVKASHSIMGGTSLEHTLREP